MAPDTTIRSEDDVAYGEGTPEEPLVRVLGCSGPSVHDWRFDELADTVEVTVSEGSQPSSRRVDFTATFQHDGGTQVVEGGFEVSTQ